MKILITELFPEKGHKRLFSNIIELLNKKYEVIALVPKGITCCNECQVIEMSDIYFYDITNHHFGEKIDYYLYNYNRLRELNTLVGRINPDYIIVVTYTEVPLGLYRFFYKYWNKTILMNHNNIDHINSNKIKYLLFSTYGKKVKHIVQCGFIAESFTNILHIDKKNIAIWPHPLNQNENSSFTNVQYDCVGISNSNDEIIIKQITDREKKLSFIKKAGLRVVLRSKNIEYDDGYLKIIKGDLDKKEYDGYINGAKVIFIPFPTTFQYRMSGTLVDAFSNNKTVIGTNIPLFRAIMQTYPHLVNIYNPDEFIDQIINMGDRNDHINDELIAFNVAHSNENVGRIMSEQFENLISDRNFDARDVDF